MPKQYSIAEARQNLAAIVHELDAQPIIELTRRGTPVAMLVSLDTYRQLQAERPSFWEAYSVYQATTEPIAEGTEVVAFNMVRDPSPGREVDV